MEGQGRGGASSSVSANPDAAVIALRLAARAEQSVSGLRRKLAQKGCDKDESERVIAQLIEENLISDERFACAWLRQRLRRAKPESPRKMLAALLQRGIDKKTAKDALAVTLDFDTETSLLRRYIADAPEWEARASRLRDEGFSRPAVEEIAAR